MRLVRIAASAGVAPLLLLSCRTPAPDAPVWRRVPSDVVHAPIALAEGLERVYGNRGNIVALTSAAFVLPALGLGEGDRISARYRERKVFDRDARRFFSSAGTGTATIGATLLFMGYQIVTDDPRDYAVAKSLLTSLSITGLSTVVLKASYDDPRPDGAALGFPSGHAGMSMTVATTVAEFYGYAWATPFYLVSLGTVVQRLDSGRHDTEDVLFGWLLGYLVSSSVATGYRPQFLGADVVPYSVPMHTGTDAGATGVGLALSWTL